MALRETGQLGLGEEVAEDRSYWREHKRIRLTGPNRKNVEVVYSG